MLHNKLHPLSYLILAVIYLLATFLNHSYQGYLIIIIATIVNLLILSPIIKYKALLIFILSMIPVLTAIFISGYLFALDISHRDSIACLIALRTFCLAFVSFSFSTHTPYQNLINYLMQKKIVSVRIGYTLLAVFNSFNYLANEFNRVQLAYRMRYHKRVLSSRVIITLLTSAARYAHNLSISMHARGLNDKKTFSQKTQALKWFDYVLWLGNIGLVIYFMI